MSPCSVDARRAARLALLGTSIGNVIIILDVTVVNVALDAVRKALGVGVTGLQWVVSAYTLVFAALLLSGGALSDRLGARRSFVMGLTLFSVASLLCGLASSASMLVAARAVQGVGAALSVPGSLALLGQLFPEKAARAKAISLWGAIGGLALAAGPVMGGALVHFLGWRYVFFINVPLGACGVWLTLRHARSGRSNASQHLDIAGQMLALPATAGVTYACIEAGHAGWLSSRALVALVVSVVAALTFVRVESRKPQPMLPLDLFKVTTLNAGFFLGFVMNFSYYGFLFALSLYFQEQRHLSSLQTGLAFLPMTLLAVIVNLFSGRLIARRGPRPSLLAGTILCTLGYAALGFTGEHSSWLRLIVPMLLIGIGSALTLPAFTVAVMGAVSQDRSGIVAGVLNAARQTGGALGVAIFGTLVVGPSFLVGLHRALWLSSGLVLLAALIAFRFIRSRGGDDASPELVEVFE